LDYRQLAERIGKKVSWVYRLEDPNATPPTIPTLLHVAAAFDIGLDVRFRAFSELLEDVTTLEPASFAVPSFDSELNAGAFWKSRRRRKLDPRSRLQRRSMRGRSHSANHVGLGRFSAPADIGSGRLQGALQVASNPWG
jgi:transcriptional regulator with XRE-family HTH domain